ncbi:MAG: YheV family putative metal-binding protein [Cellvibrionales bacterium]|nr:YheV family putative metal-binding protein [Cellvibrionales bacterium]
MSASTKRILRRFIAGATCPECHQMDKIVMFDDESGQRFRECVACGFKEEMNDQPQQKEIKTRVNQPKLGEKPLAHEEEVQAVKILDPSKLH